MPIWGKIILTFLVLVQVVLIVIMTVTLCLMTAPWYLIAFGWLLVIAWSIESFNNGIDVYREWKKK